MDNFRRIWNFIIGVCLFVVCISFSAKCDINFEKNTFYVYEYETGVGIRELDTAENVDTIHYDFGCNVKIQVFEVKAQKLLRLEFVQPEDPTGSAETKRASTPVSKNPVYIKWNAGIVESLYVVKKESPFWINFAKGVATLLNVRTVDWSGRESDTSGECQVNYFVDNKRNITGKVKTGCLNPDLSYEISPVNELFSVERLSRSISRYKLKPDGVLESISAQELHRFRPVVGATAGSLLKSHQNFKLVGEPIVVGEEISKEYDTVEDVLKSAGVAFKEVFLSSSLESKFLSSTDSLAKLLDTHRSDLTDGGLASIQSARAFTQLIETIRQVYSVNEMTELLAKNRDSDIYAQLLDLTVACQTLTCIRALMVELDFNESTKGELQERILFSLSYLTNPSEHLVNELFQKIRDANFSTDTTKAQAYHTLGTISGKYEHSSSGKYSKLVVEVSRHLKESAIACETDVDCLLTIIGAMRNSGSGVFSETLMQLFENSTSSLVQSGILDALKQLHIPDKLKVSIRKKMLQIFYYPRYNYDDMVKALAIDILLKLELNETELYNLILFNRNNTHLLKPTLYKLDSWCEMKLLKTVCKMISADQTLNNYAVRGSHTQSNYIRGTLVNSSDFFSDFNLHLLSSNAGIMKRSQMDFMLVGTTGETQLLSIGLYASGLDSLVDSSDTGTAENEDPTAGMIISIIGKALRPVSFFTGQTGLMSAVWNAPSSYTSVLKGIILLHDYQTAVHLQNGLVLRASAVSALSMNLGGSIEISLWSRTSKSLVSNSGALNLQFKLALATDQVNLDLTTSVEAASNIDFETRAEFLEMPLKMCFRMSRPDLEVTSWVTANKVSGPSTSDEPQSVRRGLRHYYPGQTYSFGPTNDRMCRSLIPEDD